MYILSERNRFRVGKTYISITSFENTIDLLEKMARSGNNYQVVVSDFRSVCYATDNVDYRRIVCRGSLNIPDGMPLIWLSRLWGLKNLSRISGPELFISMLKRDQTGLKHYLLGDTEEVLERIVMKYQNGSETRISGWFSPPFQELNEFDYAGIAHRINESGANLVWISMTSPKQDFFASQIEPLLNGKVVIGVGAAFRYSIGTYKLPSVFLQKIGLTGLFIRKKSFWQLKWYIKHIVRLIHFSAQILYWRISGIKFYD